MPRLVALLALLTLALGGASVADADADPYRETLDVYTAIEPCRIFDSRDDGLGGPAPIDSDEVRRIKAAGGNNGDCVGTVPKGASAVNLNVTALRATMPTHLTIWADGPQPNASSLNPAPGEPPVPNAVTVRVTETGHFQISNHQGSVHVVVDVNGYYFDHQHDEYVTEHDVGLLLAQREQVVFGAHDRNTSGPQGFLTGEAVVASAVVFAPTQGSILAHATVSGLAAGDTSARCSLDTKPTLDLAMASLVDIADGGAATIPVVRGFDVAKEPDPIGQPSQMTIYLVCDAATGSLYDTAAAVTATFVHAPHSFITSSP